tara:strand:+ start:2556 stop:3755 length:1200 start_codon:yes stop_codon:yes gene_type:complete
MGFFKKIFKGVKKGFKSIGKGIKSAFKKFGKFMGKIGILGQVAMMFIMPGIGGALMKGLGGIGQTAMSAMAGSGSAFLQGAAKVMQGAANFVGKASNVFRNVTEGVTNFVGEFSKTAANKLSSSLGFQKVPFADASSTFFSGGDSAWAKSTSKLSTRMGNLTASKDTIKALDSAAQSMRTLGQPAGLKMTPNAAATTNPLTGKLELPKAGLSADPSVMQSSVGGIDNISSSFDGLTVDGSMFETGSMQLKAQPSLLENIQGAQLSEGVSAFDVPAAEQSWWESGKEMFSEAVDNTKTAFRDEVTNFGSNTIKRVAGAPVAGIEMGLQSGIQQRIAGELNPQEPVLASRGAAALQMYDIGENNAQIYAPQANYGSQMGAMPYGYGAMQSGYQSFLKSSIA